MRGYIYLVSFENTNDIYIGKTTQDIKKRLSHHKNDASSAIYQYINSNNIDNVNIDVIDSIDMNEDLTYLKYKYDNYKINNKNLNDLKLNSLEMFHIHSYKDDGKYNIINKKISPKKLVLFYYDIFNKNKC